MSASLTSIPNDAQLLGGRGITLSRLEQLQNKPDVGAYKRAEMRAARLAARARDRACEARESKKVDRKDDIEGDSDGQQEEDASRDDQENGEAWEEDVDEEESLLSPDDSILILTGANASGKSVFLKTVALIVYMVRNSQTRLHMINITDTENYTGTHRLLCSGQESYRRRD